MNRQIERAKELRRDSSKAERICWELLRAHRMIRQYFADFACVSKKLVIEVDGEHHANQIEADARRTANMEHEGWKVVRFTASEVVANREGIWAAIQLILNDGRNPLS
jgi:very-short-patch-repair endonuclease